MFLSSDNQHLFPGSVQALPRSWGWCHPCSAAATPALRGLSDTYPDCSVLAGWGQGTAVAEPQKKPLVQFRWKPESSLLAAGRQQEEGADKVMMWPMRAQQAPGMCATPDFFHFIFLWWEEWWAGHSCHELLSCYHTCRMQRILSCLTLNFL